MPVTAEWYAWGNDKEMYTATYNQNFRDAVFRFINHTLLRHTYWDREEQTNYNIMLSHYFNMGSIRNVSISMTGYRYEYDNQADKGMYISLSMPWVIPLAITVTMAVGRTAVRSVISAVSMTRLTISLVAPVTNTPALTAITAMMVRWRRLTSVRTTMKGIHLCGLVVTGRRNAYCPRCALHRTQNMGRDTLVD